MSKPVPGPQFIPATFDYEERMLLRRLLEEFIQDETILLDAAMADPDSDDADRLHLLMKARDLLTQVKLQIHTTASDTAIATTIDRIAAHPQTSFAIH